MYAQLGHLSSLVAAAAALLLLVLVNETVESGSVLPTPIFDRLHNESISTA